MKTKSAAVIAAIASALTIAAGGVHTLLVMFLYDFSTDHFIPSTVIPTIFYLAVVGIIALLGVLLVLSTKKGTLPDNLPEPGKFTTFASFFTGAMLLVAVVFNVINIISGKYVSPDALRVVMLVLTVPAAFSFIIAASSHNIDPSQAGYVYRRHEISVLLRCAVILWAMFNILVRYFSMTQPLTCPLRILSIMSLCSLALYFTAEIRMDIDGQQHPRLYIFFGILAAVLMSVYFVQDAVNVFAGMCYSDENTMYSVACMGIVAYICGRICDFTTQRKKHTKITEESVAD